MTNYRTFTDGGTLNLNHATALARLAPADAREEELALFTQGLTSLLNARPPNTGSLPKRLRRYSKPESAGSSKPRTT